MGYDWVPGNLAGALALREAGDAATRVDVGYFVSGGAAPAHERRHARVGARRRACSSRRYAFRGGRIVDRARRASACAHFEVAAAARPAVSVGSTRALRAAARCAPAARGRRLPRLVRPASRALQAFSAADARWRTRARACSAAMRRDRPRRSSRARPAGPTPRRARAARSHVVAARARRGRHARSRTVAPRGRRTRYDFTAAMLAWGAEQAARRRPAGAGALGPVDGFGLDELEAGGGRGMGWKRGRRARAWRGRRGAGCAGAAARRGAARLHRSAAEVLRRGVIRATPGQRPAREVASSPDALVSPCGTPVSTAPATSGRRCHTPSMANAEPRLRGRLQMGVDHADARVARLAGLQSGAISRAQLRALGARPRGDRAPAVERQPAPAPSRGVRRGTSGKAPLLERVRRSSRVPERIARDPPRGGRAGRLPAARRAADRRDGAPWRPAQASGHPDPFSVGTARSGRCARP